ncbi:MAG: hypothetical protein R2710_22785 [Acidimicrobiales bacterium]
MRVGVAHHLGWAVLVTATDDHVVIDRRRVDLVADDLPVAPIHHRGGAHAMHADGPPLDDDELGQLVAIVTASVEACAAAALDSLADSLQAPIRSISLRAWPEGFPTTIAGQRAVPYESQADSVMYRRVLADAAHRRGWSVHQFDGKKVESTARLLLGARADDVLLGPRALLGPPWNADHRMALAATVVASAEDETDGDPPNGR